MLKWVHSPAKNQIFWQESKIHHVCISVRGIPPGDSPKADILTGFRCPCSFRLGSGHFTIKL